MSDTPGNDDEPRDAHLRTRRAFLKAAPLGALAIVAGQAPAAEVAVATPAPAEPTASKGYHETEHIRRYYQTAAYW